MLPNLASGAGAEEKEGAAEAAGALGLEQLLGVVTLEIIVQVGVCNSAAEAVFFIVTDAGEL